MHSKENNDLHQLSSVYNNNDLLYSAIKKIIAKRLSREQISNKSLLLKPNWVLHSKKEQDEICMRTHNNFLLSALKIFLEYSPAKIVIADAPVQGCDWDKMISSEFLDKVKKLSIQYKTPIQVKDLRRTTFTPTKNNPNHQLRPISDYKIIDLGLESYLEPISSFKNTFRVTDYNPNKLAETHKPGMHKYCISKEMFDADIIVSLPKIKTHQKTGITAALKNIVGINGDKDYLPHHRLGGTGDGGDCYPGKNYFRYLAELAQDFSNKHQGRLQYKLGIKISSLLWRFSIPNKVHQLAAGWYGNDTTWRMVLDLNKIITYGKSDGSISNKKQREFYSLSDGIIGGQGNGPLNPSPLPLGIITFTNHSGFNDVAIAILMGFAPERIAMLKQFHKELDSNSCEILYNGELINLKSLSKKSIKTIPPPGWIDYLS